MRFDIITIFPDAFESYFDSSILSRARKKRLIDVRVHDLRRWARGKHKSVDARPYGGGPGMVMTVEPIWRAVRALKARGPKPHVVLFSAKGKVVTQAKVRQLAKFSRLILIAGHYEGVDERVARYIADEELSIGKYVLTGGELPAMIVVDAVSRLLPGVLGKAESLREESFSRAGEREYPHYTRPETFRGWKVPKVLLSGDHKKIAEWRKKHSRLRGQAK